MKTAIYNPVQLAHYLARGALVLLTILAASLASANAIDSVEPTSLPGGKVIVRVNLEEALASTPPGFSISNPSRIVLDFPDTRNAAGRNLVTANLGPLASINIVQAGTRTRLVLNLNKAVEYDTVLDGRTLLIALSETGSVAAATATPPRFAEPSQNVARHSIKDVEFRRGPNGEARIVTSLSNAQAGINIRQQAKGIMVDFIDTEIPRALQRRLNVSDYATPAVQVESYALGNNSRMFIEARGTWEYSAYQTENQFVVEVRPATDTSKSTSDGKPVYSGEKLSLNFQNVEVRAVLQVIADFTGLNIVASDTVAGSLTLRLKDVPWDQALDIILNTKGLDKRTNGNVVWIAPRDELLNKERAELEARAAVKDLEPLVTEYIPLNYLRADEAQNMLYGFSAGALASKGSASCSIGSEGVTSSSSAQAAQQGEGKDSDQKVLSKRGRATFDLKTNTLIINDTAKKIQEVRELLTKLDIPARQIMIEARVVIADDQFSRQLGSKLWFGLNNLFGKGHGRTQVGVTEAGDTVDEWMAGTGELLPGVNLPAPASPSGAAAATIGIGLITGSGAVLALELSAMETDNRGKVVSNPRVVTTNQVPAVIIQGDEIPYASASNNGATNSTQFKTAGLCLLVDPQILNNDSVILNVEVQKDGIGESTSSGPALQRKRVKTTVRVKNGETMVLGGIYETINRNDVNKIPFLGDLPFLGYLFRNSDRQEAKVELMVFLTPRILDERIDLK